MEDADFKEDDDVDNGTPFPPECGPKTRTWLTRLAQAFLAFVTVPENVIIAYSVSIRKGEDPKDPKSAWAVRFCEAAGERVGGHRDGERVCKGFDFDLSGFVSWLYSKNYRDIRVSVNLASRRPTDNAATPHIFIAGTKKSGREFAVVLHTAPHPDVPTCYKVPENEQDDEET